MTPTPLLGQQLLRCSSRLFLRQDLLKVVSVNFEQYTGIVPYDRLSRQVRRLSYCHYVDHVQKSTHKCSQLVHRNIAKQHINLSGREGEHLYAVA